jgi:hypothetical protein
MVIGMAAAKLTIILGKERIKRIRAIVGSEEAARVSGFVEHAIGLALNDAADWKELLEEALAQTGGALTKKECAWADSLLFPQAKVKPARVPTPLM